MLFLVIILLHLLQQYESLKFRYQNIEIIKKNKISDQIFWQKVNNLELDGYILTSNYLCNKTLIYNKNPILFCFESLDYIPYLPKLVSPTQKRNSINLNDPIYSKNFETESNFAI